MFVLGLQGSPRLNGNCTNLLSAFLRGCEHQGARTMTLNVDRMKIMPCRELTVCEQKGSCPIDDDMKASVYALIKQADVVVLSSPVFFYGVSSQLKALIDRCQMFWSRKYKLKLTDPDAVYRKGFLLSVGASGGKKLFDGVHLTASYFFDAVGADFKGALTYRHTESAGQILSLPGLQQDIQGAAHDLLVPELDKKQIVFVSKYDACRSQMASAFAKIYSKGLIRIYSAGFEAASDINPATVSVMAQKGIDLAYQSPQRLSEITTGKQVDIVIDLDRDPQGRNLQGRHHEHWNIAGNIEDPSESSVRALRDKIENSVKQLISSIQP